MTKHLRVTAVLTHDNRKTHHLVSVFITVSNAAFTRKKDLFVVSFGTRSQSNRFSLVFQRLGGIGGAIYRIMRWRTRDFEKKGLLGDRMLTHRTTAWNTLLIVRCVDGRMTFASTREKDRAETERLRWTAASVDLMAVLPELVNRIPLNRPSQISWPL